MKTRDPFEMVVTLGIVVIVAAFVLASVGALSSPLTSVLAR